MTCVVVSYLDTYGVETEAVALASESKEVALSKAQLCETLLGENVRLKLRPLRPALLGPDCKGCQGLPKMFDFVHEYYFLNYFHFLDLCTELVH